MKERHKDEQPPRRDRPSPARPAGGGGGLSGPQQPPSRRDGASAPSAYPRRKRRPRIESFDYSGPFAYHIVLGTHSREPHFRDIALASQYAGVLEESARRYRFGLLAYCFMPEHMHVLLLGRAKSSNLIRLVQHYKQVTAFQFRRTNKAPLWQQSFFDRALRAEEDLAQIAAYLFENPVRAGLASDPTEYPLSGGGYFPQMTDGAEAPSLRAMSGELARE